MLELALIFSSRMIGGGRFRKQTFVSYAGNSEVMVEKLHLMYFVKGVT